MKRVFLLGLVLPLLGWGCDKDENVLPDQQAKMVSYLTGTHEPKLISEQDKETSQDQDPEFYTPRGNTSYRYIKHYYDTDRQERSEVAYGDRVTITFSMYTFNFQNPVTTGEKLTMPYYSNDPQLEEAFNKIGLTSGAWKFEPLKIDLGTTEILKGLEFALPGCRERDSVEVYMTYNMAYGKDPFDVIPPQTPIAIFFTVDEVTKN